MDINMPNENGTEAALDILQNPATRGTRVVFLSTMKDPWPGVETDLAKVAHELGAIEFIDKSSDLDKIGERVKGFLDEAAKQPAA
jgi:CheY-like chemotaxis protein